jgi:hypothetical protein
MTTGKRSVTVNVAGVFQDRHPQCIHTAYIHPLTLFTVTLQS